MERVFESQLENLEANKVASFSYGFAEIEANLLKHRILFGEENWGDDLLPLEILYLDEVERRIGKALKNATCLRELRLVTPSAAKAGLEDVIECLSTSPTLRDVTLVCRDKESAALCVRAVQSSFSIRRFELHCTDFPIEAMWDLIASNKSIQTLDLKGRESLDVGAVYLLAPPDTTQLVQVLARNNTLREIHFERFHFRNKKLLGRHHRNHSIKTVSFLSCSLDYNSSCQLAHVFGHVEQFLLNDVNLKEMLHGIKKIRPAKARPIFIGITAATLPPASSVTSLLKKRGLVSGFCLRTQRQQHGDDEEEEEGQEEDDFIIQQQEEKFFRKLSLALTNNPTLTTLEVNPVTNPGIGLISDAINFSATHLTKLTLRCLSEERFPMNLTLYLLKARSCPIETLVLQDCNVQDGGFAELCRVLAVNTSLNSFILDSYSHLISEDIDILAEELPSFNITHLALTGSDIYEDFAIVFQSLARLFEPKIEDLELDHVHFDREGLAHLAEFIVKPNGELRRLWLKGSHIRSADLSLLLSALTAETTSLKSLHLAVNLLDLNQIAEFLPAIRLKFLSIEVRTQGMDIALDDDNVGRDNNNVAGNNADAIKNRLLQAMAKNITLAKLEIAWDQNEHLFHNSLRYFGLQKRVKPIFAQAAANKVPPGLWPFVLERLQKAESCPSLLFHVLSQSFGMMGQTHDGENTGGNVKVKEDDDARSCCSCASSGPFSVIMSKPEDRMEIESNCCPFLGFWKIHQG